MTLPPEWVWTIGGIVFGAIGMVIYYKPFLQSAGQEAEFLASFSLLVLAISVLCALGLWAQALYSSGPVAIAIFGVLAALLVLILVLKKNKSYPAK